MKEDIEILKAFRNYNKFYKEENGKLTITIDLDLKTDLDKALENLLTRYKDIKRINSDLQGEQEQLYNKIDKLEEENKTLKKVKSDELIINNPWLFEYLNELYIFKGRVKEKIEEYEKQYKEIEAKYTEEQLDNYDVGEDDYIKMQEIQATKKALQELLEEE